MPQRIAASWLHKVGWGLLPEAVPLGGRCGVCAKVPTPLTNKTVA